MLQNFLREGDVDGAALVSMPTGTGKSAVIAQLMASPEIAQSGLSALVITPWSGLARQLKEDIDTRVWSRIGIVRPIDLPKVHLIPSARQFVERIENRSSEPVIYVSTFAMVLQIYKSLDNDRDRMAKLFERVSAVIVDESHYEPAPGWSQAVRATKRPICLFTATPFRNDNRMFDLREDAQFRYSHTEAVADAILREPKFLLMDPNLKSADFVTQLLEKTRNLLNDGDRVLVRCSTQVEVEAVALALHTRNKKVIAVHEGFKTNPDTPYLRRQVPPPSEMPDVQYYVHQNKLTEGFDDPSIRVLAIRDDFGNDRARIQQMGRALRNPSRQEGAPAFVLGPNAQMEDAWRRYLNFDAQDRPRSVATDPAGIATLLDAQPEVFYWDRLFRERADLKDSEIWKNLRFRLSAVVRQPDPNFAFETFTEKVERSLTATNIQILSRDQPDKDSSVFVHLAVRNSPVLREAAFVETTLGYTVLHWDGEYLFVSSSGPIPECIREDTAPVEAKLLAGLLPSSARVTAVSLTNNDLSEWAIRNRSLRARNLALIASEVGDSTFGYSTASGTLMIHEDEVVRYTGTRSGRVSDLRRTQGHYAQLKDWYREISRSLTARENPASSIARYGAPEPTPQNPKPAHVLLDIESEDFRSIDESATPLSLGRTGGEVSNNSFNVEIDDGVVEVSIRWDASRKRFELSSQLDIPYRSALNPDLGFWESINRHQSVRIATVDGLIYSNQNFWRTARGDSASAEGLLSVLQPMAQLETVVEEKGHTTGRKMWPATTVFGVIERMFAPGAPHAMKTVLCTDLGSEIADFIAVDKRKVIFVHAKSKNESNASIVSASALHEVVSQATKSLRYLTLGNQDKPKIQYWESDWAINPKKSGKKPVGPATRIRRGKLGQSADDSWASIDTVIQSHAASREVWLVLGACLSKTALQEQLAQESPPPAALQVHALLTAAWSAAQQCGIRLRVFCSN